MRIRREPNGQTHAYASGTHVIMATLGTLALAGPLLAQRVIYVAENAPGASDGMSWANAYQDLQDALDDARTAGDDDAEIWIAAGTYKPDRGTGDRTLAFELFGSIAIYGGFAGWEECQEHRDWIANETILSGDLAGDDHLAEPPTSTCCTSTRQPGCDDQKCAHTISAMVPYCAARWYFDCPYYAQTICCDVCRPHRCENSFNVVRIQGVAARVILDGVTVAGGEAAGEVPGGGLSAQNASVALRNCAFRDNAGGRGAAAWLERGDGTVHNSSFVNNQSWGSGHAVVYGWESLSLQVTGSTFARNRGGSIYLHNGVHRIADCSFVENQSTGPSAPGITVDFVAEAEIDACSFVRNVGLGGCGLLNDGYARLSDCAFIGNRAQGSGAAISNCGALIAKDSTFVGNRAGGFVFYPYEVPQAGFAGGVDIACGGAAFVNCTFVGNHAGHIGGMFAGDGATLRNCVFWANSWDYAPSEFAQLDWMRERPLDIDYTIVEGWTGYMGGVGNSGAAPMFVDAFGPDGISGTDDDDLRLSPGSPGINAGDPNTSYLPPTDLDGHARILCGRVDIGPYEFGIGDFDCDQTVDLSDFASWSACMRGPLPGPVSPSCTAFDFNADQSIDLLDFAALQPILSGQ